MLHGAFHKLTTVAALLGILLMAQQPLVRAEPLVAAGADSTVKRTPAPAPVPPEDNSGDPESPGDPAPAGGADGPSPLTLRDGVPSAMLDRLRSSSVARADELIFANRGAAVACGSPDPAADSATVLPDAVEVAAWRLLELRRIPALPAVCDRGSLHAPRDPSVATAISIHGPPAIPA